MKGFYVRQDDGGPRDPTMRYVPSLAGWLTKRFADKKFMKVHRIHKTMFGNPNIIFVEKIDYRNPIHNV